ncbi:MULTISPECIES: cell division protein ZipA C-terminal FtsZ-binding domain-containing protein [unclassified Herbaspirillum]|uniref:cell division protein ZipA C-terminal FtsZ-binding domain-containing protein n=1 Tax=unclassified Herbaspirillum TaxID=2624150 RepID=UPI00114EDB85|nr:MULTISPECIES: cell division protein ZipA C-terminal FtsZ-binding domain-containing protein [unclassified Herbaspirillum]MBB5393080.1 FtsZ-interacting cell division protein ZipA [Herbaspirillum sp. SJZ102]TQK04277.1 ZipA-like protein with FtsZ-binding domain [Herbaspirillum sp. SJZ130]TQK09938.1 ZipA-like protein with FtsZ-binding domain [Herbaspirillum sp. SJZ106]
MMDLQTSLIVIGGVFVVGVISYNKWQEHKARKTVERAFSSSHDDVLMSPQDQDASPSPMAEHAEHAAGFAPASDIPDDRMEPALYDLPERKPAPLKAYLDQAGFEQREPYIGDAPAAADAALTEALAQAPQSTVAQAIAGAEEQVESAPAFAPPPEQPAPAKPRRELPVDELIDCNIPIALEHPLRGDKLLPALQNLRHVGNKPVHFIGRNAEGEWEAVSHGGVYTALLAGAQLANRSNAMNEIEYSELVMRLRDLTDSLSGEPELPDMPDVIKTAQALHQFIADHDVQLSVNVRTNGAPWSLATLLAALTRQGFDRRTEGYLVMQDGEGEVLFALSTNASQADETTDRLTLLLDVPRVAPSRDGYGALVACARSLVARLGGTMVDDSNQMLSDAALADIAEQVAAFYSAMESADIPAGSTRALRLFS